MGEILIIMIKVVELLKEKNKSIAVMESCTGGAISNAITNVEGASAIFCFGAVTYSNEYKIKLGVPKEIIDKFTVYSLQTAQAMALAISNYVNANFGIGITGKLKKMDINNLFGDDDLTYISIYDKINNIYYNLQYKAIFDNRIDNKKEIVNIVAKKMVEVLSN